MHKVIIIKINSFKILVFEQANWIIEDSNNWNFHFYQKKMFPIFVLISKTF